MGAVTVVASKSPADLVQLRFYILSIEETNLRQDGTIQEEICLVPGPSHGRNCSFSSECGRGLVPLVYIRLYEDIARQNQVVVCLEGVGLGNIIIRCDGRRNAVDMGSKTLVVGDLGQSLVFCQLGLDVLCPSFLAKSLGLGDAWGSVLGCIGPGGCQDLLVDLLIVWAG